MDTTNLLETLRKEEIALDDWMSMPSRRIFNQLLFEGTVVGERDAGRETPVLWDLCRCFHPTRGGMNTCWDTKRNTRPANNGSRIDYVLCSDGLKKWFVDANIQEDLMGSDHCPVFAVMADRVESQHGEVALADLMNPPGMFRDGRRVREWSQKDVLPLSAKLIPEFDRRQSIRDMFSKKSEPNAPAREPFPSLEPVSGSGDCPQSQQVTSSFPSSSNSSSSVPIPSEDAAGAVPNTRAQNPPQPSPLKRQSRPADGPMRSSKRSKAVTDSSALKAKTNSGQKTLQGFFKPMASRTATAEQQQTQAKQQDEPPSPGPVTLSMSARTEPPNSAVQESSKTSAVEDNSERVFDPIQAKESWSKLLGKRLLPRCEHDEPCISLVTKKPGVNCGEFSRRSVVRRCARWPSGSFLLAGRSPTPLCQRWTVTDGIAGRSFYICPRPLGPSGEKEKGSEWRCGTFIWSSDWNGHNT